METNENAKREHYQAAERELFKLIEEIEEIKEGNIKKPQQAMEKLRRSVQHPGEGACQIPLYLVQERGQECQPLHCPDSQGRKANFAGRPTVLEKV